MKNPANNPNWKGGIWIVRLHCKDCGKQLGQNAHLDGNIYCLACSRQGERNHYFGKHHTEETKGIMSLIHGGTGIPYEYNRYPKEFHEIKVQIRNRDNHRCQNCGMTEEEHLTVYGRVLDVHHIDYNKQNCNSNNLITTCMCCNIRANYNRDYWKKFYITKMENINVSYKS
jgi:hypothetical protein